MPEILNERGIIVEHEHSFDERGDKQGEAGVRDRERIQKGLPRVLFFRREQDVFIANKKGVGEGVPGLALGSYSRADRANLHQVSDRLPARYPL